MKLLTTLIILFVISPSAAYSWQWRITERANCANGQCVAKYQTPVANDTLFSKSITNAVSVQNTMQDCPDGRCPLLPKQGIKPQPPSKSNTPTLALPEPRVIVQARPVRSVMVQPVRRVFQWRPFRRLFGRR